MGVGKTSTALGAYHRRLAYRIGKPKAITATARKIAILVYRVLRGDIDYCDPGVDAYEAQHRTRTLRNLRNRAQRLGFALLNLESGQLLQGEASQEAALLDGRAHLPSTRSPKPFAERDSKSVW